MNLEHIAWTASSRVLLMFLWWSPLLFLEPWLRLSGRSRADVRGNLVPGTAFAVAGSLVMALVLDWLRSGLGLHGVAGGAMLGLLLWAAFTAPALLSAVVYEGKSLRLFLINGGFQLAALLLMGVIGAW
jgi:hypothetical protein